MSAPNIYRTMADLKGLSLRNCAPMPEPSGVLMCPPKYYNVLEVKNPLMIGHIGTINRHAARAQWEELRKKFGEAGREVSLIDPVEGLEDMVFCANQVMVGLNAKMEKVCLLGAMRHPSRRREVAAFEAWFSAAGYRIKRLEDPNHSFEGAGDALWHPGKRLIWGGYGFRSDGEVYPDVARAFDAPVILLKLVNERFYHLDTCFCPLTPEAVLVYPPAFDPESLGLILKLFPIVVVAEEPEATRQLACNAAVVGSKLAIIQRGSAGAIRNMAAIGLKVIEVDTSEYIKSGGSVYCMKMFIY